MLTVATLLVMSRCASCERELDSTWKFCVYCGRPLVLAAESPPVGDAPSRSVPASTSTSTSTSTSDDVVNKIPAAIRFSAKHVEPAKRGLSGPAWVGIGVSVLGLVFLVFVAVQIFGARG